MRFVAVIERMSAVLGHIGAWAPRAEQVATVGLLDDANAIHEFETVFHRDLQTRLDLLHRDGDGLLAQIENGRHIPGNRFGEPGLLLFGRARPELDNHMRHRWLLFFLAS